MSTLSRDGRAEESATPHCHSSGSAAPSTIDFTDVNDIANIQTIMSELSHMGEDLDASYGSNASSQSADSGVSDVSALSELEESYGSSSFNSDAWHGETPQRGDFLRDPELSMDPGAGARSLFGGEDTPAPSRATRVKKGSVRAKPTKKRAAEPVMVTVPDVSAAAPAPTLRPAIKAPKHDCTHASPLNSGYDDDLILGPVAASGQAVATAFRKGGKDHIQLRFTSVDPTPGGNIKLNHSTFTFDDQSKQERWQHFAVHRGCVREGGQVPYAVFTSSMNAPDMTLWTSAGRAADAAPIAWQGKIGLETYPMLLKVFGNVLYVGGKNSHYNDLKEMIPTGELLTFALDEKNPGAPTKIATHPFMADRHGSGLGGFDVPQLFDGVTQLDSNGSTVAVCGNPAATVRYKNKTDNAGVVKRRRICPEVRDTVHHHAIELLAIGENGAPLAEWSHHRRIPDAHNQTITGIEWQGERLFSCGWDSKIKIWHVPHHPQDGQPDYRLEHAIDCVLPASISAGLGGGAFLTTGMDGYLRLWPMQGKKTDSKPVDKISFSSKSLSTPQTLAVVGCNSNTVNGAKGRSRCLFTGHSSTPTELDPDWFRGVRAWDIQEHGRPEARVEASETDAEPDELQCAAE